MTTSVIICTRNRHIELVQCLKSIAIQTRLPDEVLIVDASDEDQVSAFQKSSRFDVLPIKYIHTKPGLTRQRNVGIDHSQGDVVFFFDDDVILTPDYIAQVVDFYERYLDREVGGVQGVETSTPPSMTFKWRLLYDRLFFIDRIDKTSRLLPSGATTHLDYAVLRISPTQKPFQINLLSGCMMSFRRRVLHEYRFDERYADYSHGEDVDFTHRVAQNYALFCIPTARLEHRQTLDHNSWYKTQDFWCSQIHAQGYLFHKHKSSNILNYLALLWSWIGIWFLYGVCYRNSVARQGILKGIIEILRGDQHGGDC